MALRQPLVVVNGRVQQLQAGDTIPAGTASDLALNKHVIASSMVITAGYSSYISRYIDIASGVTVEIGADSDLEIG